MKQKSFLKKLYEIFILRECLQDVLIFIAGLVKVFFQASVIASIFPFINVIMNPDIIQGNKWLSFLYHKGNFSEISSFIFFLGISVLLY